MSVIELFFVLEEFVYCKYYFCCLFLVVNIPAMMSIVKHKIWLNWRLTHHMSDRRKSLPSVRHADAAHYAQANMFWIARTYIIIRERAKHEFKTEITFWAWHSDSIATQSTRPEGDFGTILFLHCIENVLARHPFTQIWLTMFNSYPRLDEWLWCNCSIFATNSLLNMEDYLHKC